MLLANQLICKLNEIFKKCKTIVSFVSNRLSRIYFKFLENGIGQAKKSIVTTLTALAKIYIRTAAEVGFIHRES